MVNLEALIEKLRESEVRLKKAERIGQFGYWEWDATNDIIMWSEEYYLIHGFDPKQPPPKYEEHLKIYTPDSAKRLDAVVKKSMQTGQAYKLDLEQILKDGTSRWTTARGEVKRDENNQIIGLRGTAQDITERKHMEKVLLENETRYRSLVEGIPGIVYSFSHKHGGMYYSSHVMDILGYSPEQLYAQPLLWHNSIHPDDVLRIEQIISDAATGKPFSIEYRIHDAQGNWHWFNDRSFGYQIDGDNTIIEGLVLEITERKQAEITLHDSETRYRMLFEHSPDGIVIIDPKTAQAIEFNETAHQQLNYSREEFAKLSIRDIDAVETTEETKSRITKVISEGRSDFETLHRTKQGEIRNVHVTAQNIEILGRSVYHCVWRDITERKHIEEKVRASQQIIEGIINAIPVRVFWKDNNLVYLGCNTAFARDAGFADPKDIIGKDDYQMVWHEQAELYRSDDRKVIESGNSNLFTEEPQKTPEGNIITLLTSKVPLHNSKGEINGILGTYMDISDKKKSEESLKKSEAVHRAVTETALDAIVSIDSNDNINSWNYSAQRIFGYAKEEIIGKPFTMLITNEYRRLHKKGIKQFDLGNTQRMNGKSVEIEGLRKDETVFPLELSLSAWSVSGEINYTGIMRDITKRKQDDDALKQSVANSKLALDNNFIIMRNMVEARDPYTAGHEMRVDYLATAIGKEVGLNEESLRDLSYAAGIHDIGKISIPAEILSKPGKLSKLEFELIKGHAQAGYDILKNVKFNGPIAEIVYQHHERINGSGYPRELKGDDILLEAKILAVADTVEAMISHRPYRPSLGIDKALEEIEKDKGILYDIRVADACINLFKVKNYKIKATS